MNLKERLDRLKKELEELKENKWDRIVCIDHKSAMSNGQERSCGRIIEVGRDFVELCNVKTSGNEIVGSFIPCIIPFGSILYIKPSIAEISSEELEKLGWRLKKKTL